MRRGMDRAYVRLTKGGDLGKGKQGLVRSFASPQRSEGKC